MKQRFRAGPRAAASLGLWLCHLAASAQSASPPPLPSTQPLTPPLPKVETRDARLPARIEAPPPELSRAPTGLRLDVQRYDIDGARAELHGALAAVTAPFAGPGRRYEDLQAAAAAVTRYLQIELGYYLAHAYVPAQRPQDGRVRIQVLEGRLDRVVLDWAPGIAVDRSVVEAHLARLQPGAVLRQADVERVVFLLNDLRGLAARFEFREGRDWGTSELIVRVTPTARSSVRVDLDADGSRFSGLYRLGLQGQWASPLGRGDALTLSTQTSSTGGLAYALASYAMPIGGDGFKLGTSLSAMRYRLDRDLLPQDVRGHARAGTLFALYPLLRSRNGNLFSVVSAERKRFVDRQGDVAELDVQKHSDELRLGLSGDAHDDVLGGGSSTYEFSASVGRVAFDQQAPAGSDDDAHFRKLGYALARTQTLIDQRLMLFVQLRGQQALANLDATQQFRLGGVDGVRAFASGEAAGDSGQVLTLELRAPIPGPWPAQGLVASLFHDAGRVRLRHDSSQRPAGFVNHRSLAGSGVGLAWEQAGTAARIQLSWPTRGQATSDTARPRPRVNAQISFAL